MSVSARGVRRWVLAGVLALLGGCGTALVALAPAAHAARSRAVSTATTATAGVTTTIPMADGTKLTAVLTGAAPIRPRPTIVEFSPYGFNSASTYDGTAFNYLLVQDRGTGDSGGSWDALGPQTQADVAQSLAWACRQSWSKGDLGLMGFSASAITIYNSMWQKLPCVRVAVLKSGTFSLYRDLLYPGGINNFVAGVAVLAMIGGGALETAPERVQNPATGLLNAFDTTIGLADVGLSDLGHPTLDDFWQQRQFRGDANRFPILMVDSFYDVESPGAFEAFRALESVHDRLLVVAGHDGSPAGTDGGVTDIQQFYEHYLLGERTPYMRSPRVQMLMSDGSREGYDAGSYVRYSAPNYPVPGTTWQTLYLGAAHPAGPSGLLLSNDGSLHPSAPPRASVQSYLAVPSIPTMSDTPMAAIIGPDGLNVAARYLPLLSESNLESPLSLNYTTAPLSSDVISAGPAALDVTLASVTLSTQIWAVISDVAPNGQAHPVASGRLDTRFPLIDAAQSIVDSAGQVVGPYGDFTNPVSTPPLASRTYQLSFWPIGNEFKAGDRIRLTILGSSALSMTNVLSLNSVTLGGASASRLLLPVLPVQTTAADRSDNRRQVRK